MLTVLRKVALQKGVNILNHIYIYDLLKGKKGRISGVVGISLKDRKNYLIHSKAVILATNSGGFRGHHLASELQGTGPFMAYDAGARIKNPEFHYINIRPAKHEVEGSGIMPAIGAKWINAKGELYMEKYDPVLKDRAPTSKIIVAAAKEAMKGNAPVAINVEGMTDEQREKFRMLQVSHGWMPILFDKCKREEGYDILEDNIEWQPAYESNKLGIDADVNCQTSLEGLYAAGMARTLGVNPFTGWSIASSTWSGFTAGNSAAKYTMEVDYEDIDFDYVVSRTNSFFAPLQNEFNENPDRMVTELQKILFPADVLILMNEPRLKEALSKVLELKQEKLPGLHATDIRTLVKVKEAQTMVLAAEMSLKGAIMRKESRPNIFYREDYTSADDNWLKWLIVQIDDSGEMNFSTQDIPFDQYKFRPENPALK
ncbi:succinate dehydrogenase flavoprotein subunit [Desulfocucumis palustris]|uniref:Succinate dehydrogenase flavoprotein subunit n=2 Tax=Desulfocucumis palustris TaxID=1898651 RepID=A0A2L2XFB1_9FIRM|nr:succinate dehydrogenase flavoprotein subunit [Desulfocucumis palustris]